MSKPDYSTLDQAYRALEPVGSYLPNGFINHAPMVAEALCAMGQAEAALAWVTDRLDQSVPRQQPVQPIEPEFWKDALGDPPRESDWTQFFRSEIERFGWRETLDRWAARLAPGFVTAAAHGVIRVGHAARAIAAEETDIRLRELADGFGLWASAYAALPASGRAPETVYRDPSVALKQVPFVPDAQRRTGGAITAALKPLAGLPGFAETIFLLDLGDDPVATGRRMATVFAEMLLAQAHTPLTAIVYTHAVTGVAAALKIAPHVREETARALLAHAWQTGCALYAAYGQTPAPGQTANIPAEDPNDIVRDAVEHGDDHVIKLSEACLSLYGQTGDQIFLCAPGHARVLLPPESGSRRRAVQAARRPSPSDRVPA